MSKNDASNLMLVIAVIAIVIGLFLFLPSGSSVPSVPGIPSKNKIVCDVTVENVLFGTASIKNYQCRRIGDCLFGFSAISLGILGQKGEIRLVASDALSSQSFEVGSGLPLMPLATVTKSLSMCTKDTNGQIQLLDENSNIIDSKQWGL